MAEIDPLKPVYPARPLRKVEKGERREKPPERHEAPRRAPKDGEAGGEDKPQVDEYA
jgi:hypothetical protein